jgi:tetratricopeptide (TPR) repeat protein
MGDQGQEANALGRLALINFELGRVREALACSEQALAICQEVGDHQGEAANLQTLGICYARLGQAERGIELGEQALAIFRELGDRHHEAIVLKSIGAHYLGLKMDKAIEATQAAVQIFDEIGGPGAEEAREDLAHYKKIAAKKWWQFWL